MKIGIIGASGYIGRSLIEDLNLPNAHVVGFSRQEPDLLKGCDEYRKLSLEQAKAADFYGIEALVLCASATNPATAGNNYLAETNKNILPHIHLLNVLKETDVRHIVYLSSGGTVYGNQIVDMIDENCLTNPVSPYGYGKVCIEKAIVAIWPEAGRKYTIIRPSNPVGKYQLQSLGAHGLVTTAYTKIKNGEPITIYGDGNTIRDFFHVIDLCALIKNVLLSEYDGNDTINASAGVGHSINQIVESVAHFFNVKPKLNYVLNLQPEIAKNVLCNRRACSLYDWSPTCDIAKIIELLDYQLNDRII